MAMRQFGFTIAIVLVTVFLFFNSQLAFGDQAPLAEKILISYMLVIALFTGAFDLKITGTGTPASAAMNFTIMFIATAMLVWVIPQAVVSSVQPILVTVSFGFLYAFVIAFNEEVIFRDILPKKLHMGDMISNVLFAIFHASALVMRIGFSPWILVSMGLLFLLGIIWSFTRDRFGIIGSTGSHFAYNLYAYGILGSLLGIGVQ